MKAVFLDVDGVINEQQNGEIDEQSVEKLANICKEFDADVVLYSGAKYLFDNDLNPKNEKGEKLAQALESHDIAFHKTPNLLTKKDVREKKVNLVRPAEIIKYLSDNKILKYSIIGKKRVQDKVLAQNQVIVEDGLKEEDVEEISKIMG